MLIAHQLVQKYNNIHFLQNLSMCNVFLFSTNRIQSHILNHVFCRIHQSLYNLIYFYYRYVFANGSARSFLGKELFYKEIIEEDFNKYYLPKMFEKVSKEFLIRKNRAGFIKPPFFNSL